MIDPVLDEFTGTRGVSCQHVADCESYPLKCSRCKRNLNRKKDYFVSDDEWSIPTLPQPITWPDYVQPCPTNPPYWTITYTSDGTLLQ